MIGIALITSSSAVGYRLLKNRQGKLGNVQGNPLYDESKDGAVNELYVEDDSHL